MDEVQRIELVEDLKLTFTNEKQFDFESDANFSDRTERGKNALEALDEEDIEEFLDLISGIGSDKFDTHGGRSSVAGYMLEILYKKEHVRKAEHSEKAEQAINDQLRSILNSPFKGLSKDVRSLKRPDLVELHYDEADDKYLIKGATEVTHGVVESNKFLQLTQYREDLSTFLELFKKRPSIIAGEEYKDLREALEKIEVAQDFEVHLVISDEKDLDKKWEIYPELTNEELGELDDMQYEGELHVTRSAFSKQTALEIGKKLVTMHQSTQAVGA